MSNEYLIASAKKLVQPPVSASSQFSLLRDKIADLVTEKMTARKDIESLIGPDNLEMMKDNAHNMARFMESIFISYDPQVLVNTVLWVFRAYRSHGFKLTFWSAHLNTWIELLKLNLTPQNLSAILPFFDWMQINIPAFTQLTDQINENEK